MVRFAFASWQFVFYLARDGEGAGGPFWNNCGTILVDFYNISGRKHENHQTSAFFLDLFCLVAVFFYLARDAEGAGGPVWDHLRNTLYIVILISI